MMTLRPADYDASAFTPLAVTVDVVVLTVVDGVLTVLLAKRAEQPALGSWALPGVFVRPDEELDAAARRAAQDKAGVAAPVRQFQTFGGVARDPRMRIVSVGYMAAVPGGAAEAAQADGRRFMRVTDGVVRGANNRKLALPFDHAEIIAAAAADLRHNLDHSAFAFGLLPREFSLRELQQVHEAVRGASVNKPAFRKRLLESGWLEPTGRRETDKGFRPAELYTARAERRVA
ncbi:NUDIX hydrolase [Sphingomonas sp. Tas61C01]|uniref:NUDIX hydrolase n=1 Tax=Sphingomonas sp. Tas61C01 TaxID=3458297 RepID=UPI00403EC436